MLFVVPSCLAVLPALACRAAARIRPLLSSTHIADALWRESQVHGVTIASLPANAVSYYESGDVSVVFSIPSVSVLATSTQSGERGCIRAGRVRNHCARADALCAFRSA